MVSISFTTFLLIALAAISQVAVASPTRIQCKEIFRKDGPTRTFIKPWFTPTKTNSVIVKEWLSEDGTRVQVKHLPNDHHLLRIKTTNDRKHKLLQLASRINGDQMIYRYFKLKKNQTCYVAASDEVAIGVDMVTYNRKKT